MERSLPPQAQRLAARCEHDDGGARVQELSDVYRRRQDVLEVVEYEEQSTRSQEYLERRRRVAGRREG